MNHHETLRGYTGEKTSGPSLRNSVSGTSSLGHHPTKLWAPAVEDVGMLQKK